MKYIPVAQRINNRNNNALVNGAKQIVPIHAIDQGIVYVIAYSATGNKFISLERRGVGWSPAEKLYLWRSVGCGAFLETYLDFFIFPEKFSGKYSTFNTQFRKPYWLSCFYCDGFAENASQIYHNAQQLTFC